jgi:potassium-transporting ATPase potassium-binding subunit
MSFLDWSQILIFIIVVILIAPLIGKYMALVLDGKPTPMTPIVSWLEVYIYRFCKISPADEMTWKDYLKAVLTFNGLGFCLLFLILILQTHLPLNPEKLPSVPWDLAFNTAASFTTNTNWQAYSGETTLSYFTQMVGLTTQNFLSAATGIGVMLVLIRGFKGKLTDRLGNFWVDLVRTVLYILLPLSFMLSLALVSQGVVQTLKPYNQITTLENEKQVIPLGPAASQIAIKQLGSNGGGFFGANSAHPFENPSAISNFLEDLAIVLIPSSLLFTYGYLLNALRQGSILFYVVMSFWVVAISLGGIAASQSDPSLDIPLNMEGIETRLEVSDSYFWTISTTNTSNGSTNASISSLLPLVSGLAMFNMMLGEQIMGGVGVGICILIKFVILSVFIAGLMIGRTPEYLGKKIGKIEISWVLAAILVPCGLILIGSAISYVLPLAHASISHKGPHGFSEIIYAFTSAANNNGSAFDGLKANTPYYNVVLGFIMILGRLAIIVPSLAIAGSVGKKRFYPQSQGSLATDTALFGILLSSIIFIVGALSYFPALVLGPIFEHLLMLRGATF